VGDDQGHRADADGLGDLWRESHGFEDLSLLRREFDRVIRDRLAVELLDRYSENFGEGLRRPLAALAESLGSSLDVAGEPGCSGEFALGECWSDALALESRADLADSFGGNLSAQTSQRLSAEVVVAFHSLHVPAVRSGLTIPAPRASRTL
jgi:hypothetical protein